MKKLFFLLLVLFSIKSIGQVNVVGYIQTNGVANYPTHIDSMGKGGYIVAKDTIERNNIPCLRRKYGMAVYSQAQNKLYILKDSSCANVWIEFTSGGGTSNGGSSSFGSFYDTTTQTIASTTTAYIIKIAKTDTAKGFTISNNKIICQTSGVYNLQWSGQFSSLDNAPQDVNIWIKKNGVDVIGSTGFVGMGARKNPSDPYHVIAGWNYILPMTAGDSVTFYWAATSTNISIKYYPITSSPTKPSTASMLATITPVISGGSTTLVGRNGINTSEVGEIRWGGTPIISNIQVDDTIAQAHSINFGQINEFYAFNIKSKTITLKPTEITDVKKNQVDYPNWKILIADTTNNWKVSSISTNQLSSRPYYILSGYVWAVPVLSAPNGFHWNILENTFPGCTFSMCYGCQTTDEYTITNDCDFGVNDKTWMSISNAAIGQYATTTIGAAIYSPTKDYINIQLYDKDYTLTPPNIYNEKKIYFEIREYFDYPTSGAEY